MNAALTTFIWEEEAEARWSSQYYTWPLRRVESRNTQLGWKTREVKQRIHAHRGGGGHAVSLSIVYHLPIRTV